MDKSSFLEFLESGNTLRVYQGKRLIFSSDKDRLFPLLDYISQMPSRQPGVVIFDKLMGNAAALLSIKAGCREVCSPLGSQLAVKTLEKSGIKYHITEIVPFVLRPDGQGMCPMEKLSIDKEPEEFYAALTSGQAVKQPGK
jgi:hypothetical protein